MSKNKTLSLHYEFQMVHLFTELLFVLYLTFYFVFYFVIFFNESLCFILFN